MWHVGLQTIDKPLSVLLGVVLCFARHFEALADLSYHSCRDPYDMLISSHPPMRRSTGIVRDIMICELRYVHFQSGDDPPIIVVVFGNDAVVEMR